MKIVAAPLLLLILSLLIVFSRADEQKYIICMHENNVRNCQAVERGGSRVKCAPVVDNAECAIRLARGEADFGVFEAEELLLAYQFYPSTIQPIFQLRHKDQTDAEFEYESVAVVPSEYKPTENNPGKGGGYYDGLMNSGLCHPGFGREQWWNDYILKYMERKMYDYDCRDDNNITVAENELLNINKFFGKACRPGPWVADDSLDDALKRKYPELCSLCDDPTTCRYANRDKHGHYGALDCLTSNRGKVAYVALNHVRNYFKVQDPASTNDSHQFLCPDGSVQPLSNDAPCTWISQPWKAIAARRDIANNLANDLSQWFTTANSVYSADPWEIPLKKILCGDDYVPKRIDDNASLVAYLGKGRTVDFPNLKTCGKPIGWCTVSDVENSKCEWIAKEALILGIEPKIVCKQGNSTFRCFRDIAANKADIMTIDSNYGHLARQVYNLKTILYSETDNNKNSMVLAVVRKPLLDGGSPYNAFSSLDDLRGKKACFPEYGGIAWLSVVHVARTSAIFTSDSCDYTQLMANFFSGACTPGLRDRDHSNDTAPSTYNHHVLCSVCPRYEPNNATTICSATPENRYYADKGALQCLSDGAGDVAFVEARNLNGSIDPNAYHILCKNGSLSARPGFHFDDLCAFSVTIDSEVVGRRNGRKIDEQDQTHALLKLEDWLGYRVESQRPIHIYRKFDNIEDLLFKDSTSGLVPTTSEIKSVLAYKELFSHVEACSGQSQAAAANHAVVAVAVAVALSTSLLSI